MAIMTSTDYEEAWNLWLQTGWNASYKITRKDFTDSWNGSLLKCCRKVEGELVAIGRANSDGVLYAMIHDVVVHPMCRKQGHGRELVNELIERLRSMGVRVIQLMAAVNQKGFYESLGFAPRNDDAPGMQYIL